MTRIVDVDAMYKTKDVYKNLKRFAKRFPEAAEFCELDEGHTNEEIAKCLPITDKYFADGTINEEWTYYFNIDIEQDGMYMWFIKRA
jgi:hypothetical protein